LRYTDRMEKLSGAEQVARLRKTGLAEAILPQATHDGENWIARYGRLLDKAPSQQFGIAYDALVNAIRRQIPDDVERIYSKAIAVSTRNDRQKIVLADNEMISARQVVIANGLNVGLRKMLGIESRSLDLDRLRSRARRPPRLRLSRDDLFLGAAERPDPLYQPVSDRRADARQSLHLSRPAMSGCASSASPR